jgi:NAD(P)-dependent dehydrogenase (short-subunit alcohol dehydrogenase family)
MDLQLHGKTALVTGSSKGIGAAIAARLAKEGATVVVHGRDRALSQGVAAGIAERGGRAFTVDGDLTREDEVRKLVEHAQAQAGPVDIVVNNAGGSGAAREGWSDTRSATWMAAYDRNVLAALRVTTALLAGMRERRWGRVINISSLAATLAPPSSPDYAASKAAMNALTASLAKEAAGDGVTVNAVSPGTIRSAALESRFREVAAQRGLASADAPWNDIERVVLPLFAQVPLGRTGQLDEIAAAVAFLASPLADYITGVNLRVDGGLSPVL